ncbi:MAG: diphosphate--fructose-6-phosphate 1-phosphotransferase, partial [Lachnospiraceae bacterium]|uniref:diphosphate--fructose-6-phosphate 1-phosphotransferase n=1 Tax=Galactobacillus timonensis TaxID=2041840 RepID=UPI0023F0819E
MLKKNLLIVHGGGPTAVMNGSLYGAIKEAKKHPEIEHIYGAENGTGGILRERFIELGNLSDGDLDLLLQTPGSAIGTSRDALVEEEYSKIVDILVKNNIGWVLMNGGNGTMDTCGKLYHACKDRGLEIACMGIPKTTDNDLALTDHSPGYGSAARYIAQSARELCADVQSLPIHVVVMEASGRNAGWITAASALAGENGQPGPDLIYLPERNFSQAQFLEDV